MSRADVLVISMPALRMGQRQPVHEIGEFTVFMGPQNQMPMVGHQAVGKQPNAGDVFLRLGEDAQERLVIAILVEDGFAAIASIESMVDIAADGRSQGSSHAESLSERRGDGQGKGS